MLSLLLISYFHQRNPSVTIDTPLGEVGSDSLFVRQIYSPVGGRAYSLKLHFFRERNGRAVLSKDIEIGQCFGVADAFCVGYFTQSLRRQVFVSTEMGEVITFLFDYTGSKLKVLYDGDESASSGRVRCFPTWDSKGRFAIVEQYGPHSATENGKPVKTDPDGMVTKIVYPRRS